MQHRVRLLTSKHILDEVETVLFDHFQKSRRFVHLALQKILRIASEVKLPDVIRSHVPGDPDDSPIVQTALSGKADLIVTADKVLLELGKVQDVEIISLDEFELRLPVDA